MPTRRAAPLALAVLLAGCGNPVHSHYSVKDTAPCLRKLGYRVETDASKLGPVEASAPEGALQAFVPGNAVRIDFAENDREAANIERLYRRVVPRRLRPHIDDVMASQKNVVLLWTVTPAQAELSKVLGCLK